MHRNTLQALSLLQECRRRSASPLQAHVLPTELRSSAGDKAEKVQEHAHNTACSKPGYLCAAHTTLSPSCPLNKVNKAMWGRAEQTAALPPQTGVLTAFRQGRIILMRAHNLSRLHPSLLIKSRRHPKSSSEEYPSHRTDSSWPLLHVSQATKFSAKKVVTPPSESPGLHFPLHKWPAV